MHTAVDITLLNTSIPGTIDKTLQTNTYTLLIVHIEMPTCQRNEHSGNLSACFYGRTSRSVSGRVDGYVSGWVGSRVGS